MIEELSKSWKDRARAAIAWREDDPLEPVLEALALSVAVEITGDLGSLPSSTRDELRRVGQRALLHVGALFAAPSARTSDDTEDAEEGLRIAVALARDGLRALAGRPPEREPERPPPAPREIARLLAGRLDPYEAASIARRIRASPIAREELAWSLRQASGGEEPVRLAAADGDEMRDPAIGRRLLSLVDDAPAPLAESSVLAEIFVFSDRLIAVYASSGDPVRVEGEGLRTEVMQPGYWAGRSEGEGAVEGVVHVGEVRRRFRIELDGSSPE